jgi:hypothetical protein
MLDLPKHSILVGGLEMWTGVGDSIHELRLIEKLKKLLELSNLKLYAPPAEGDDPTGPKTGITGWQFPEWFIVQDVERDKREEVRARRLVHRKSLTKGKFIGDDRKKYPVVPIRFVRACRRGHIGDIDWYAFVHRGQTPCRRPLWIEERGTSGDLLEISIRCECDAYRELAEAGSKTGGVLGKCDGARPWLGPAPKDACDQMNRLLVRAASNAYFPHVMSVISLPDRHESLEKAVNQVWEHFLQYVESLEDLQAERRKKPPVKAALGDFTDDEVFAEVQNRRGAVLQGPAKTVKQVEFEVLSAAQAEIGKDQPDGNFFARALPREIWDAPWMAPVERVVMVHRLREVSAQVGFTRFEAVSADVSGELDMLAERAALARETTWLPAVENRGEGVFIQFRAEAVREWQNRDEVEARAARLKAGFHAWQTAHPFNKRNDPDLPYYLMHTFSHMLLTAVSLECGYPASSIRERVYGREPDGGYGILLYTGTPDAEGTLGGLVETARDIRRHFRAAFEVGRLCSNDPVCAQHDPAGALEARYLHGAACHGCLLVAETSCEQHNDFLDRALVVPTVDGAGTEFFKV